MTADNLPILKGLSIKRVLLNPGTMRTPHWHANATELTYCVSGTALVSILDDGSTFSTFVITAGQMFHAASGSLHHIENMEKKRKVGATAAAQAADNEKIIIDSGTPTSQFSENLHGK